MRNTRSAHYHRHMNNVIIENVVLVEHSVASACVTVVGEKYYKRVVVLSRLLQLVENQPEGSVSLAYHTEIPRGSRSKVFPFKSLEMPVFYLLFLDVWLVLECVAESVMSTQTCHGEDAFSRMKSAAAEHMR